ncbi:hypothetical protein HML84_16445 [Alcanivorax sp. IO_7]|nr:hypothetical protein HML84_16445 [Alcanivorax sp. IO_7]
MTIPWTSTDSGRPRGGNEPPALADPGVDDDEDYAFTWPGKAAARAEARAPARGVLRALPAHSLGFDDAPHAVIEGTTWRCCGGCAAPMAGG